LAEFSNRFLSAPACFQEIGLFTIDGDGPAGADLPVQLQRVVKHLHVEGFFFAVELDVFWYSP
jgi:hypothetical protein